MERIWARGRLNLLKLSVVIDLKLQYLDAQSIVIICGQVHVYIHVNI